MKVDGKEASVRPLGVHLLIVWQGGIAVQTYAAPEDAQAAALALADATSPKLELDGFMVSPVAGN